MPDLNIKSMLHVGTLIHGGVYRIDSYLASGGFGNTYVVRNIEFDEKYALKEFYIKGVCQRYEDETSVSVSNAENAECFKQQLEKFKKEARRIRSLNNEHIVKVHDLFKENGTAYYVMDLVDGESLAARLKRTKQPLTEAEVNKLLPQILDGLKAIHDMGIWHLDIKPANIMVDKHGIVKLIDFGASKQQSSSGGATMSTVISYTLGYAPSEQMAQEYEEFGPWTDFYALGATLYNLLTLKNPPSVTKVSDDETEDKHIALPMIGVSVKMKKLIAWMMQDNRKRRPQKIEEIQNLLAKDFMVSSDKEKDTYTNTIKAQSKQMSVCNDETVMIKESETFKKDSSQRNKHNELDTLGEEEKRKEWNNILCDCKKRFIRKCRIFSVPLGLWLGYSLGMFGWGNSTSVLEDLVGVLFFCALITLLVGIIGIPYFLYWFTKGYWVKRNMQKVIDENFPKLQSFHKTQMEQDLEDHHSDYMVLNCLYYIWPIGLIGAAYILAVYCNMQLLEPVSVIGMFVFSFVPSWIVAIIIVTIFKVTHRS